MSNTQRRSAVFCDDRHGSSGGSLSAAFSQQANIVWGGRRRRPLLVAALAPCSLMRRLGLAFGLVLVAFALSAASAGASTPTITEFSTGLISGSLPSRIVAGPDGNLWFADAAGAIGEINPTTHAISEFSTGLNSGSIPDGIAAGPDGNLWFTDDGCVHSGGTCAIGEINPTTHAISEFSTGLANPFSVPVEIAAGPDGNLWFTLDYQPDTSCSLSPTGTCAIGEINPTTHAISEFSTGLNFESNPNGIAAGPDGNLWFTDPSPNDAVGEISPTTDAITEFSTGLNSLSHPYEIAAGPDGNMWFTDRGVPSAVGEINPRTDAISEFSTGLNSGSNLLGIAAGPDGNMWFADAAGAIGEINPTTDAISEFSTGLNSGSAPDAIAAGADGNLWFTDPGSTPAIGEVTTSGATHTLTVTVSGSGSVTSAPAGISCPGTCSHAYTSGTRVTLTAAPASGSTFAGWSGGVCSGTGTCVVTISSDQSVTATFNTTPAPGQRTLTVTLTGTGSGSVSGTGISCPGTCSHSYTQGTVVTLTATPASGSVFGGWSGGGCSGTATSCSVTMSSDQAVSGSFNPNTVVCAGAGHVPAIPAGYVVTEELVSYHGCGNNNAGGWNADRIQLAANGVVACIGGISKPGIPAGYVVTKELVSDPGVWPKRRLGLERRPDPAGGERGRSLHRRHQ